MDSRDGARPPSRSPRASASPRAGPGGERQARSALGAILYGRPNFRGPSGINVGQRRRDFPVRLGLASTAVEILRDLLVGGRELIRAQDLELDDTHVLEGRLYLRPPQPEILDRRDDA